MKIEKLNDRQIRCTLSKQDLTDRQLRISELAYGSDKAKALFQEMMQRASAEFGFEAEDIPLMIEAIPLSGESLVLVVTKVEDPEELDTRFSKFTKGAPDSLSAPVADDDYELSKDYTPEDQNLSDILDNDKKKVNKDNPDLAQYLNKITDLIERVNEQTGQSFIPLHAAISKDVSANSNTKETVSPDGNSASDKTDVNATTSNEAKKTSTKKEDFAVNEYKLFKFDSLESVIGVSSVVLPYFKGNSTLYKLTNKPMYLLLVAPSKSPDDSYTLTCSIMSEYARQQRTSYATRVFLEEHYDTIIKDNAIPTLSLM